jgi:serine/threonine-protein kinase
MSSPTDELSDLQRLVAGRYEIVRELGRGGMGVVYLARDVALERPVAIKLLPRALAAQPELRERFMREIRTAAGLSHPNIVPIFSVEEREGLVFYAMGFVDGETLAERVQRAGPQPPSEVARVLQEAAWALSYAHGRGIIHRDVKPDNILIEHATGRAFLTDFGIAHLANSTMTAAGISLGTPHYMSPEQAAGEELDARSDIYSLGIVGYVALTGKLPFDAPTVQAILAMHLTREPPSLTSLRPGLPERLAETVERCLAKDPAKRWGSAEELTAALQRTQAALVAEIAPQVRSFLRFAESQAALLTILLSFIPIMFFARPAEPVLLGAWLCAVVVIVVIQLRVRAALLVQQGFGYDDVRAALTLELRQREEERELVYAESTLALTDRARRRHRLLFVGGLALVALALVLARHRHIHTARGAGVMVIMAAGTIAVIVSIKLRTGRLFSRERRSARLFARLWEGWFGRAIFRT